MQSQQLSSDNASNINNNNISKQQQQQQQQMMMNANYNNEIKPTLSQNDFWFNDKINETPVKPPSPIRPMKSLFSPSPEHPDEKSKYMMMTSNIKPERAVDSPKEERKSTPSKREKMTPMSGISTSVNQSQKPQMPIDKKFIKNETPSTVDMAALSQDPMMPNRKRPYAADKSDSMGNIRAEKVRKVEGIKTESSRVSQLFGSDIAPTIPAKQPIETNPDIVKSLLKECFSSSNKFDQYDNDSPLDVINPEPPEELLAVPSKIDSRVKQEPMDISVASNVTAVTTANAESEDKMDSSAGEGHSGKHKKKSKKKKDKHKHKKKHKHSDRESSPPMRLIVSKNNSPESNSALGGLKIKIPIKDVASAINPQQTPQPAPIKLKISKEKFGSFTNLNNNNNTSTPSAAAPPPMSSSSTSSSSSHKNKKDKDRDKSKSKSSKHGSDYKESSSYHHHHQQHSA